MELLKDFDPSYEHLRLLKYLLIVLQALLLPFVTLILGSTIFSLLFNVLHRKSASSNHRSLSRSLAEFAVPHGAVLLALGVLPLAGTVILTAQILHKAPLLTPLFQAANAVVFLLAFILVYFYRNLFRDRDRGAEVYTLQIVTGIVAVLLLLKGLFVFNASTSLIYDQGLWGLVRSPFQFLFSWNVIARTLTHLALALAVTGSALLFFTFHWRKNPAGHDAAHERSARIFGAVLTFAGCLILAPLTTWNIITLPSASLSANVFLFSFILLFVLLAASCALVFYLRTPGSRLGIDTFVLILLAFFTVIVTDHFARENATKEQSILLGGDGPLPPGGSKIKNKMSACFGCHSIDGTPRTGPTFKGLAGRKTTIVKGGVKSAAVADDAYLKRSLLDPGAELVDGFQNIMPPQTQFSEKEVNEILEYLKTLK